MIIGCTKKIYRLVTFLVVAAVVTAGIYYGVTYESGPIYSFNDVRDTHAILDIFDKNWYWLIANDDSSPAFYIKNRTPGTNPVYFGKMLIKVARDNDNLIGFVTYYMQKPDEWHLLFMAVNNDYRGHGWGQSLVEYAMQDMINRGAKRIWLLTRLENLPAQRIYKALGFVEFMYSPAGYVYFEYIV